MTSRLVAENVLKRKINRLFFLFLKEYTRKLTVPQFGKQDIRFANVTTLLCLSLTLRNEAVGSKLVE